MGGVSGVRLWLLVALAHACTWLAWLVFSVANGVPAAAPLAWSGATGMPLAWLFNLLAWSAPGLLLAYVAIRLRAATPSIGMPAGIALRLLLLASLAFAAQGLLPLDPDALDAGSSRLHATAWMVWLLAFGAGAVLSGIAMRAVRRPALLIGVLCLLAPVLLGPVVGPRVVLAAWAAWTLLLAWRVPAAAGRGAAGQMPR